MDEVLSEFLNLCFIFVPIASLIYAGSLTSSKNQFPGLHDLALVALVVTGSAP